MSRAARRALSVVLAGVGLGLAACGAEESTNESPPADLGGGGEIRQGDTVLGQVERMADCRYRRETLERCAERRSYPRTAISGLRDLRSNDLQIGVPTSWRVELRALDGDRLLRGWSPAAQIIDYGVIRSWSLSPPDQRHYTDERAPPAAADALRVVAYGDDFRARGFELALPSGG